MMPHLTLNALYQTERNLTQFIPALYEYGQAGIARVYEAAMHSVTQTISTLEEKIMGKHLAEFQIIGRVGKIMSIGQTVRVSIAAEYGKKKDGDFESNPYWNEVTVFEGKIQDWVAQNINAGDLVHVRGTIRQTSYEKDDTTTYGITLAVNEFSRLAQKSQNQEKAA